ncbi:1362_t:CDS:2 [Dentiscutata heterogama]|uniref:1362_t:CDS:1 n=1 Tax=Dentiscutata heterogama TaxID=1316150 RepID=A0ACA9M7M9_9GLOM|nr:1362_t:CDS:2 [Dentiscutata heterogama]
MYLYQYFICSIYSASLDITSDISSTFSLLLKSSSVFFGDAPGGAFGGAFGSAFGAALGATLGATLSGALGSVLGGMFGGVFSGDAYSSCAPSSLDGGVFNTGVLGSIKFWKTFFTIIKNVLKVLQ